MKQILAFGGSNSKKSINKTLATFVANKIPNVNVTIVDLNDFELPLYGPDLETEIGIPEKAIEFSEAIKNTDGIVLSLGEYNGFQTTAFKNLFDWLSRIDQDIWKKKPMFLMATSPGQRGGASVLKTTIGLLPFFGGNVIESFSLPSFHQNFSNEEIVDEAKKEELNKKLLLFQEKL
ncbi:MAG: NADPH-dependent FMN reductase [Aureispira sp.]